MTPLGLSDLTSHYSCPQPPPTLSSNHAAPRCSPRTLVTSLVGGHYVARGFPLPGALLPKVSSLIMSFLVKPLLPHPLTEGRPDHLILKLYASRLCPTLP